MLLCVAPACADVHVTGHGLQIFAPGHAWRLMLPGDDWKIEQGKIRAQSSGFYYLASSGRRDLHVSIFVVKTDHCSSGDTCRALFWSNPGPFYKNPKDVHQYDEHGFSVVRFRLDDIGGVPVRQANLSAHAYVDGYWIDVRISKAAEDRVPDINPLAAFFDSVSIKQ
jgi:hypothetical protein